MLRESESGALVYVARFSMLQRDLNLPGVADFLKEYGYESADELRRIYGDAALQIAAECVFETNARSGQILFKGTLTRCLHYIDAYVSKANAT